MKLFFLFNFFFKEEGGGELSTRVSHLERELKNKVLEIKDLKEKVSFFQSQQTFGQGASPFSSGAAPATSAVSNAEIDQIKRDKSIAVGLVNTMQKDLANKDSTISKLAREIEGYKNKLKEREVSLKDIEEKFNILLNSKKMDEDKINKEKELIVLKTVSSVSLMVTRKYISCNFSESITIFVRGLFHLIFHLMNHNCILFIQILTAIGLNFGIISSYWQKFNNFAIITHAK